jgi:uncharacterized protein (DUF58 family)
VNAGMPVSPVTSTGSDLMNQIRRIEIRTRHKVEDLFAGSYLSVFKGRGIEFDEVRPYQTGDDIRSVDWNVTARMGELYVKRFIEERELTVLLMVDVSGSQDFGSIGRFKREAVAEMAALLAFAASRNNDKVGLLLFSDRVEKYFPPRKGRRHILRLVRELLTFQPAGRGTDLKAALDYANRMLKRRGIVFLLSDFQADPQTYRKALDIAGRRHDLVAIDLRDPLEKQIAPVGLMILEDAETGELTEVDTADPVWRKTFSLRQEQMDAAIRQVLNGAKVDRIELATPDDFVNALTRFFQNRMRRLAH